MVMSHLLWGGGCVSFLQTHVICSPQILVGSLEGKSPVLTLVDSPWTGQRKALTLRGFRQQLALLGALEAHGNFQKLLIAGSIPHKQLLVLADLSGALVKYLPPVLHCSQVLLLGEACAIDIGHPVPRTFPIDKMAQVSVFKDLNKTGSLSFVSILF